MAFATFYLSGTPVVIMQLIMQQRMPMVLMPLKLLLLLKPPFMMRFKRHETLPQEGGTVSWINFFQKNENFPISRFNKLESCD
jgi:hypothetical protein